MRAASGVSPGSTLPPGNSQSPASGRPGGRLASSTRPSASTRAQATTSRMSKPMPTLQQSSSPQLQPPRCREAGEVCGGINHPPQAFPCEHPCRAAVTLASTEASLAAVISIDGDVIVRQITGPDRGLGGSNPDVGVDQDLSALHISGDRAFDIVGRPLPIARNLMRAKSDREFVAVRRLTRLADGHDDAAPVGILAKNCCL